ncbi:MAG: hypothetical protein GY864_04825 [Desulfobacterales bacterium]|nr:hypothetical protein [Desulfobacterales bacterium]
MLKKSPKGYFISFLWAGLALCIILGKAHAYVMPAEQLISLVTANFTKFDTLIITQSTQLMNPADGEVDTVFEEKLFLKAPASYGIDRISPSAATDPEQIQPGTLENNGTDGSQPMTAYPDADISFRRILMAGNADAVMTLLAGMGIDLSSVAFTRLDGVIAYRVGDKGPESPRLLIEKKSFLPLLLSYRINDDSGQAKLVTVGFKDYRKKKKGWYPYEIVYSEGQELLVRHSILSLEVNSPIKYPLSEIPQIKLPSIDEFEETEGDYDERRIRDIIEALREKYQYDF